RIDLTLRCHTSGKNDCFAITAEQHAIFEMIAYGRRQHPTLDVAALAYQFLRAVGMVDVFHILGDDRPLIEVRRHVVCGGTDHFDAAGKRLLVWTSALECRQKAVMD